MHPHAFSFFRCATTIRPRQLACEFGARDVNGSARSLFPEAAWFGIDALPGPGVDYLIDCGDAEVGYLWPDKFDACVCSEVLEHAQNGRSICISAYKILKVGGVFLISCATEPRRPHSGIDGDAPRPGEFYANVSRTELESWLDIFQLTMTGLNICGEMPADLYAMAFKL